MTKKTLKHFGVLGMHWGVHTTLPAGSETREHPVYDSNGKSLVVNDVHRIGQKSGQSDKEYDAEYANETAIGKATAPSITPHPEYIAVKSLKGKTLAELSTKEIQAVALRMQVEKQYRDLNKSKTERGREEVSKYFKQIALNTATPFVASAMVTLGTMLVKYALSVHGRAGGVATAAELARRLAFATH